MEESLIKQRSLSRNILLISGIIFVAFNLRAALTSVGPVVSFIQDDLVISHGAAGFVTTLPLLAFAVMSSIAPRISQSLGNEWTIMAGLAALLVGILIRSSGWVSGLFGGTVLIGAGIAAGNVLLPSVIKSKFPSKVGLMTSVYTTSMNIFATIASGVSVPLAHGLGLGWQWALASWGALAVIGMAIWIPQLRKNAVRIEHEPSASSESSAGLKVIRSPIVWKVTFFMGLSSFLFYSIITWLPEIVHSQGLDTSTAGFVLAFVQLIGVPGTFFAPVLADRYTDQRWIIIGVGILYFAGLAGFIFSESFTMILFWSFLLGLAQGATISLALTLISMRSANAKQTASVSGLAQSFGYLLASLGPVTVGFLFDTTDVWIYPLGVMLLVVILMTLAGIGAGRNRTIDV